MPKGIKGFQKGHVHTDQVKMKIGNANRRQVFFWCDFCGRIWSDRPSSYKKKKLHFCRQKCHSFYRKYFMFKEEQNSFGQGYSVKERKRRVKTRLDTNHAIRAGILKRKPCRVCGLTAEAHHLDYDNALSVDWLCFQHHRETHQNPKLLTCPA